MTRFGAFGDRRELHPLREVSVWLLGKGTLTSRRLLGYILAAFAEPRDALGRETRGAFAPESARRGILDAFGFARTFLTVMVVSGCAPGA